MTGQMNQKDKAKTTAVIYIRVSTDEQKRDNNSLEFQEKTCREFCHKQGWTVDEVFADEGVSAWADVKRPAFLRMMAYTQQHKNVNLVFLDYSRFGRKALKGLKAIEDLGDWGVRYVAAARPDIDSTTAAASALAKNDQFVLSKSDPHEEQDLARCKPTRSSIIHAEGV